MSHRHVKTLVVPLVVAALRTVPSVAEGQEDPVGDREAVAEEGGHGPRKELGEKTSVW